MPCRIVFANLVDLETWPNHLRFRFLPRVRSLSYSPMAAWIFLQTYSLTTWALTIMFNSLQKHLISKACLFILTQQSRSIIHRHTERTREHINFIIDPRDMFCPFHVISPNRLQLCKSSSGLCNPLEILCFGAIN